MVLVAIFHVFEPSLDIPQRGTDRGKTICDFLQLLGLATKKPELFFLGLVLGGYILTTNGSTRVTRLSFPDVRWWHTVAGSTIAFPEKRRIFGTR